MTKLNTAVGDTSRRPTQKTQAEDIRAHVTKVVERLQAEYTRESGAPLVGPSRLWRSSVGHKAPRAAPTPVRGHLYWGGCQRPCRSASQVGRSTWSRRALSKRCTQR